MISITRVELSYELSERLREQTLKISGMDVGSVRQSWKAARNIRRCLRRRLDGMAPGIRRCMYCGDNLGTDIDHFEPLAEAPLRAFDWFNHLLSCSYCNSNIKRDRFPRAEDGTSLLVDPTAEDPYDHLELELSTGRYEYLTARGEVTIEIFGLNRTDLRLGRARAFTRSKSMIRDHLRLTEEHRDDEATEVITSLREQPFADVLYAMLRYRKLPGAVRVLRDPMVIEALADPVFHLWS